MEDETLGSAIPSNRSLRCSDIKVDICGATGELVADLTQEVRDKLKPPIPPYRSLVTIGASSHRVQASHLVAG